MKKSILFCIGVFLSASLAWGQEGSIPEERGKFKNAVYASFGGAGIYYSLMYERTVWASGKYRLHLKGGIGSSFSPALFPEEVNIPLGVGFLYGKAKHHMDASLNLSGYFLSQYDYISGEESHPLKILWVPSLGYRYQKPEGGLIIRLGISPVMHFNALMTTATPWIDFSVGYGF